MISVTVQLGSINVAAATVSNISVAVTFPRLQVSGAGGLLSQEFITNGESSQVITGMAGKTVKHLAVDGTFLKRQSPNAEWTYTKATGTISYVNDIPADLEGIVFYTNS